MTTTAVGLADLRAARDDLQLFARIVGVPLTAWQAEALRLDSLFTVIVGARQVGKSRALAVLAVWWAFRRPNQSVLIVSAGEDGARRVLREVRQVLNGHPLLSPSVVDEQAGLVLLDNGSRITATPQSERAIRGERVDLLLVDESAVVTDDVLEGALLPTVSARVKQGARVVMAGTPWGISGWFYRWAVAGESGVDPSVRTFRWRIARCPWVSAEFVEGMRGRMTPVRFRSEYECEFVDGGAGLFSRTALMDAVAGYKMLHPLEHPRGSVVLGADWGNRNDSHALCALGFLDDGGENGPPIAFPAWLEASQRSYDEQVRGILAMAGRARRYGRAWLPGPTQGRKIDSGPEGLEVVRVYSEANGAGQWPTEHLEAALPGRVVRVNTTQASKELAFGRLQGLLAQGRLLLPDHDQLLRQLSALEVTPTQFGGIRIAAAGAGHDDLALALSFAVGALSADVTTGRPSPPSTWDADPGLRTGSGIWTPTTPSPREGGLGREADYLYAE